MSTPDQGYPYNNPPAPQGPEGYGQYLKPHRASTVLAIGIISLVACGIILGPIAWSMGNKDLREMDAGLMDPTGRDMTKAGKICAMISTILNIVVIGFYLIFFLLFIVAGAFA